MNHPARSWVLVVATDLILVVIFSGPWTTHWWDPERSGVLSSVGAFVALPIWGGSQDSLALAPYMDHWHAGAWIRVGVFLLLHPWAVNWVVRRGGSHGVWRSARTGGWVLGPLIGALAGLTTIVAAGFDPQITVEGRADLRTAARMAVEDGAYWGLLAGAACWLVLTVAVVVAREPGPGADLDDDRQFTIGQVYRLFGRALLVAAAGVATACVLLAVLGGPLLAPDPSALEPSWAGLVRYVRPPDPNDARANPLTSIAAILTLAAYLVALFALLTVSAIAIRRAAPLRRFLAGWNAVTWAALLYALARAWSTLTPFVTSEENLGIAYLSRSITEVHDAAPYTAVVGWIPALVVAIMSLRTSPLELSLRGRPRSHEARVD